MLNKSELTTRGIPQNGFIGTIRDYLFVGDVFCAWSFFKFSDKPTTQIHLQPFVSVNDSQRYHDN